MQKTKLIKKHKLSYSLFSFMYNLKNKFLIQKNKEIKCLMDQVHQKNA